MKITFIRPHIMKYRATDALEPLVFAILASLTPPDIELVLYDERLEPIPYDEITSLSQPPTSNIFSGSLLAGSVNFLKNKFSQPDS